MGLWLVKEQWVPASPPIRNVEGARSAAMLDQIVGQFGVATHPRYQPLPPHPGVPATPTSPAIPAFPGATYCKTFAEDVAFAMTVIFPHWVDSIEAGNPAPPHLPSVELNINHGLDWLLSHGITRYGWRVTDELDARAASRRGELALAVYKNPTGGHGHVGVLRPPRPGDIIESTWIAQAGETCFEHGPLTAGFGKVIKPTFVVHP